MTIKDILRRSPLAGYGQAIREAPRETIFNRPLLLSAFVYALGGMPVIWDQGASSVMPSLPGFQEHFKINSGANADEIRIFISIVYVGYGIGAGMTFFINDVLGRIWPYRLYTLVYCIGTLMAIFSPNTSVLYGARVVQGLGLGAFTVSGTMSIVEIAPAQIRGLLASWFNLAMGIGLVGAVFCTLGCYRHIPTSKLQYQIVMLVPMVYLALCMVGTFFIEESPRWLFLVNRREEAMAGLSRLRGLPVDDPRVQREIMEIEEDINRTAEEVSNASFWTIAKETFTKASNLRRVQQSLLTYALAQLSGANLITSYFVPILAIVGVSGGTDQSMFLSGMYGLSKFFFVLIATFFFVDALGRRKSLFLGAGMQLITHIYLAVYVRYSQMGPVSEAASNGAIAALFIHAFGYGVGLYLLPYIFGGELWPNRIRSFGAALSQTFHWLFIYGMQYSMPSILSSFHQWGAFLFFAAWCAVAIIYNFLMIPEVSGLTVEEIEDIFKGPWFNAYSTTRKTAIEGHCDDGEGGLRKTLTPTAKDVDDDGSVKH
ncbi:general substrate transporter [Emericellopsis atlantica]|uniref:General substrate transporter n=1 Tax=Emericellopsis atlantica TaxID=2614577 RepID=A0A9P8CQU2_9HYPO|nr:general substrate transporter [Emericellopsis atlantica]KAG9254071.1 general substrate transporter [Emericellopsis atlantica]